MFSKITQKKTLGSVTKGRQKSTTAPHKCITPYNFSAFTYLSAIIPVMVGIKMAEIPIVEKIAPNCAPDHPLFWNQYAPTVNNHAPQIKNCMKFNSIKRNLIFIWAPYRIINTVNYEGKLGKYFGIRIYEFGFCLLELTNLKSNIRNPISRCFSLI